MATTRALQINVSKDTLVGTTNIPAGLYQTWMDEADTIFMSKPGLTIRIPDINKTRETVGLYVNVIYFLK